jgi:ubiquitin-protein ligase
MTAGVSFRQVRERRLQADRKKLANLVENSHLIRLAAAEGFPPEEYEIHFSCKGITRVGPAGPVYGEHHRVHIDLPLEYPTKPPNIRWLTPLFHPNINAEGTWVCISHWYPSKFLDDLCIMLGRMIQYKNYNPYSFLNPDAAKWALEHSRLLPVDRRPLRDGDVHEVEHEEFEIRLL